MLTPSLRATSWMGWLFVIGSACFAVGVVFSLNTSWSPVVGALTFFVGSIFFTSASSIQMRLAWRSGPEGSSVSTTAALLSRAPAWTSSWIQWIGTIFFGISAIGAYVVPATDELLNAQWSNGGTFLGALCFLVGAWLVVPRRTSLKPQMA